MQELVILPLEVTELAKKVSEGKRIAVNELLNQVFAGTADWERQVDEIEVKGVTDKMSIDLAEAARKNAKNARLAASDATSRIAILKLQIRTKAKK